MYLFLTDGTAGLHGRMRWLHRLRRRWVRGVEEEVSQAGAVEMPWTQN